MMTTLPAFELRLPTTEKGLLLMQTVGSLAARKPEKFSATITTFVRKRENHMAFLYGMVKDRKLDQNQLLGNLNIILPELGATRMMLSQVEQLAAAQDAPIPVLRGLIVLTSQVMERIAKAALAITSEMNMPIRFEMVDDRILAFPAS